MLKASFHKDLLEAGCDEAGRGCLAGPVFAAAVILPKKFNHKLLNDSKQLTHKQRMELRPYIEENALAWSVASMSVNEIDEINILWASFAAMHKAITQLSTKPEHLLIDGNRFKPFDGIPHRCIVEGDAKFRNIAAGMGIVVAVGELSGGVVAPVVAGWLADRTTLETPMLIAAAMSVAAGIICLFLKETNPAVLARREAAAATAAA